MAAWLDFKETNVAVLLAPNNEQMSVFATCCALYCTDATSFPEKFAYEILDVYVQHFEVFRGIWLLTAGMYRSSTLLLYI